MKIMVDHVQFSPTWNHDDDDYDDDDDDDVQGEHDDDNNHLKPNPIVH